jgi:hypothetical protein
MVDDQSNPQHPPPWFTRSEEFACLCPAPFFHEELDFPGGSTVVFRYAVVVATGEHAGAGAARLASMGDEALARTGAPR